MSIFDLLFIVLFLATVVTLLAAASFAIRGQGTHALAVLRKLGIWVGAYLGVVAVTSLFWPRTVLQIGEPRCFDDWCIAVENVTRQTAGDLVDYLVTIRLSSTARRVSQRENDVVVYMTDATGHRFDPVANKAEVPFNVRLGPQESVVATRIFEIPADTRAAGLIITHRGGFSMGWIIIGYETWFRKPTIVRLR